MFVLIHKHIPLIPQYVFFPIHKPKTTQTSSKTPLKSKKNEINIKCKKKKKKKKFYEQNRT